MSSRTVSVPSVLKRAITESLAEIGDRELLSRFVDVGDESAFAAILDRHGPMLHAACRRIVGDPQLANDVLQATFLLLVRQCRSIRQRDSLAGWLYRVAERLARKARFANALRSSRERLAASQRPTTVEDDPGWDELCRLLDDELLRLPECSRVPLLLCYLEGRTQDEAARQIGWSLRTLRRRLDKARNLLKARMIRRGATLGAGLFAEIMSPSFSHAVLTSELHDTILAAATGGKKTVGASIAALAMVNSAVRMATITKIAVWSALALLVGSAAAGMIQLARTAAEARQPVAQVPAPASDDRKAVAPAAKEVGGGQDRVNDRLPEGALSRLGAVAFRHGEATMGRSLTFTADGKSLISAGGGWVRRWRRRYRQGNRDARRWLGKNEGQCLGSDARR